MLSVLAGCLYDLAAAHYGEIVHFIQTAPSAHLDVGWRNLGNQCLHDRVSD